MAKNNFSLQGKYIQNPMTTPWDKRSKSYVKKQENRS